MHTSYLQYYKQFRDKIFTYFLYRVGFDHALAEDLTSEVFIKAFEKFDSYDQERPFQAWIYRIAHNHLVNHYRASRPQISIDELDESGQQIADAKYLNGLVAEVDQRLLLEQISLIPKKYSTALLYRYVDQLEYIEIAELLEINEGNARVLVHRAQEMLREKFDK